MSKKSRLDRMREMASFRLQVIGNLLSETLEQGELQAGLKALSQKSWNHPKKGPGTKIAFSTLESWYYDAKKNPNNLAETLANQVRADLGVHRVLNQSLKDEVEKQYKDFPEWTVKLHFDNLKTLWTTSAVPRIPSYMTVLRYFRMNGLNRKKNVKRAHITDGQAAAISRLEKREVRSYEKQSVGSLFHLDFHHGSRTIQTPSGERITPLCLAIHDDYSRLTCHIQWFTAETAQFLVHGLIQAIARRGLPWAVMTDNGAAMKAAEFVQGLERLGVEHEPTLPYSPNQNAKTERFWGVLESRLMPMLKNIELTLESLNEATLAWVEQEYNQEVNKETKSAPIDRFRNGPHQLRDSPKIGDLKAAFRQDVVRKQRRTDGTVSIEGRRFEVPSQHRTFRSLNIRYARWDFTNIHMIDDRNQILSRIYPIDKGANASGERRSLGPSNQDPTIESQSTTIPPLLQKYLEDFAATGQPAPYLPE
jgi:transposase InsO family protein